MIEMPHRSVTRFFIPLIDVMTLLFCIFLLLPVVKDAPPAEAGAERAPGADATEIEELRRRLSELEGSPLTDRERQELETIRRARIDELQKRLAIRVLEIDGQTGKLYSYDPDPVEIASEAEAASLIRRHREQTGGRELYYLFLFPRKLTGYPQEWQRQQYERWFRGVAHGDDNPQEAH